MLYAAAEAAHTLHMEETDDLRARASTIKTKVVDMRGSNDVSNLGLVQWARGDTWNQYRRKVSGLFSVMYADLVIQAPRAFDKPVFHDPNSFYGGAPDNTGNVLRGQVVLALITAFMTALPRV
jgi:hypothetical protein